MPSYTGILLTILVTLPLRSESQGSCSRQLDVALIIDQSGSILTDSGSSRIWQESILEFAAGLVHILPIGPDLVRLGVVKFSTNARVAINLDEYKDRVSLEVAVRDLEYGGGETNIAEGLSVARNLLNDSGLGARNGVKKVAVLISDGRANLNKSRTQVEGNSTRAAGVEVFCVGVTNLTNEAELKGIASSPTSTHYYFVSDRDVLNKTLASILTELCTAQEPLPSATFPTITPMTSTTSFNWTGPSSMSISTTLPIRNSTISSTYTSSPSTSTLSISSTMSSTRTSSPSTSTTLSISSSTMSSTRTSSPNISTITAPQSSTPIPVPICLIRADIVLIIDESRDEVLNGYSWYDFVRAFSIGIINALPIAPYIVRVGVVTYNTAAQVDINLGQYPDAESLERAIRNLQFQSGDRNTADGLNVGRNLLFNGNSGARPRIQKVAFLITNGRPSRNRGLTQWEADLTKSSGVEIFSIGVTNQVDEIELKSIASIPTATHYYYESNYNSVTRLILMVLNGYCTPLAVTPSSSVVSTTSSSTVNIPSRQQDIPFNATEISTTTTTATTRQSISATTPGTTTSTTQSTSTSNTIPTTPTTTTTTQSTSSTSATPNTPTLSTLTTLITPTTTTSATTSSTTSSTTTSTIPTSASTIQSSSTTSTTSTTPTTSTSTIQTPTTTTSTTTSSTTSTTTTSTIPTTSSSTIQSSSTTSTTSTTPTTSTSTIQTPTTTTSPTTSTTSTPATRSTSATINTPTTTTTRISIAQSASTASTTSAMPTTSTATTQNTPTTTTSSTTPTISISTTTTRTPSASTTVTSTTQSSSASTTTQPTSATVVASTARSITSSSSQSATTVTTESTTPPTTVTPCPKEIDIVLILDETTSIVAAPGGYENWYGYILGFAEGFVNVFQIDPDYVRIGVVKFSSFASVVITLDQYSDAPSLVKAVRSLEINGGQTNIAAGLRVGRSLLFNVSLGAREGAKKMAFLVTDGRANVEHDFTQTEANITRAAGVEIYCIGVTSMIYEAELINIASAPTSTHYYFVINYNMLSQVLEQLEGTICFAVQLFSTTIGAFGST